MILLFIKFLSFFSITISFADERITFDQIKTGFYSVETKDNVTSLTDPSLLLGHYLYIGERHLLSKDHTVLKQKFGVFSKSGALLSDLNDKNLLYYTKKINFKSSKKILLKNEITKINESLIELKMNHYSIFLNFIDENNKNTPLNKVSKVQYISHRGSTHIPKINPISPYPANTMGSIEDALSQGFKGIEIDLSLALNFNWMVSHDDKLGIFTDCNGRISERSSADFLNCNVTKSTSIPETKFLSFKAPIPQPLMTLKTALDRYGKDLRLKYVILDVKPTKRGSEGTLLSSLLNEYPKEILSKIIILVRNQNDEEILKKKMNESIPIAVEDSSGYNLINAAESKKNDSTKKLEDLILNQGDGGALSLSVGLGLAFGNKEKPINQIFKVFTQFIKLFPDLVSHSVLNLGKLNWSEKRATALNKVISIAKKNELKVIAWTVNSKIKLKKLAEMSPDIDLVLTDLPYSDVVKVKLSEMEKIQFNEDQDIILENQENTDPLEVFN